MMTFVLKLKQNNDVKNCKRIIDDETCGCLLLLVDETYETCCYWLMQLFLLVS